MFPKLRHFVAGEFDHPDLMDTAFLKWADEVRADCGVQWMITDDARTPEENQALLEKGASTTSLHLLGRAIDFVPRVPKDMTMAQVLWRITEAVIDNRTITPNGVGVEWEIVRSNKDFHCHLGLLTTKQPNRLVIKAD